MAGKLPVREATWGPADQKVADQEPGGQQVDELTSLLKHTTDAGR
jgi:hypothetical protein